MSQTTTDPPDVLVVGAGVIGLSVALACRARGLSITVLDREGPAAGASTGNAGAFAFSDILPLASPGIWRKAPRWLFDPLGPLSVPPAYAVSIAPWLFRFWRASSRPRFERAAIAQSALMALSKAELEPFLAASGTSAMLRKAGNLEVYESLSERRASEPGWRVREAAGIEFRHLDAREMAQIQPGLSKRFTHGTFTPGWYSIAEPRDYVLALAARLRERGGRIETGDVKAATPGETNVRVALSDGRTLEAPRMVLCAGAFSQRIAATFGERIPLETERGYNTTLAEDAFDLRTQVTFGGHGFVATRLASGVRVGGAVELGGLDRAPDWRRSDAMLKKAAVFLPGLKTEGGRRWMGFRPSLPDSLPAIGFSSASARIVHAFGHGHLGLTQSAGTARLVADLLTNGPPAIDLQPFSPRRF